eukprot:TRINITY_DN16075_c0_g1_i1.p2 TRINITY_DN16075_c0_g1~~TRINITY_DN16075_c0_g1_i1.p2  ORF type:complete len:79 (-),score=4.04 TRINITY_DN16075_c0_g1_i1:103-339(-)
MIFSFLSFGVGAVPPLLPWAWIDRIPAISATLAIAVVLSFGIGIMCSKFTHVSPVKSGFRQLFVSVLTAILTILRWII